MVEYYIAYIPLPSIRWGERHIRCICYILEQYNTLKWVKYVCILLVPVFFYHSYQHRFSVTTVAPVLFYHSYQHRFTWEQSKAAVVYCNKLFDVLDQNSSYISYALSQAVSKNAAWSQATTCARGHLQQLFSSSLDRNHMTRRRNPLSCKHTRRGLWRRRMHKSFGVSSMSLFSLPAGMRESRNGITRHVQ